VGRVGHCSRNHNPQDRETEQTSKVERGFFLAVEDSRFTHSRNLKEAGTPRERIVSRNSYVEDN